MPADQLDVSVVLPVYDEVGHLADELKRIKEGLDGSGLSYEIIALDDGSTDGSTKVLDATEGIRVIRLNSNRGSGTVRKMGTRAARGRVVVWTDADMSYPNDKIPWLVDQLDGFDQVVGARISEKGTIRWARAPAKFILRKLAEYLTESKIPDLNSGFRAFRRSAALPLLHLLPRGFSCTTTMTMTFLANGLSIKHVPIEYESRAGTSKFHWRKDSRNYLQQIIRLVMRYAPLRIFVPPGIALLLLGFAKLAFDVLVHPVRVAGNTLLLLFAALQLLSVGLLADLVVDLSKPNDAQLGDAQLAGTED
ncbi:MAG TPA: glycosyltransferase family 2 protein [Actinomycetota bacterium]|nr:glycosyltransferase family 2 protein [Actinomycetota bacterium]